MDEANYKVSVFSSKLGIPLHFVVHTHIVTEHAGVQNRYDVFAPFTTSDELEARALKGVIYKNLLPPETGFLLWFQTKFWWHTNHNKPRWQAKVFSSSEGTTGSATHRLFSFIEAGGVQTYPHHDTYRFIQAPNSNTFTQWVVDQVPECGLTLPWNAWGKGYKK